MFTCQTEYFELILYYLFKKYYIYSLPWQNFSYILLFTSGGKLQSLKYLMHELLYTICKYLYFMAQHTWHFKTLTKELNRFPANENSKMNWMRNFARKKFCEYHKCCYSCNNYLRKKAFGSLCSESSALEVLFYHN